jgi:hypothetical protein
VDEGTRVVRPPIVSAARYRSVTAFFHDNVAGEPNGFWTRGHLRAQVTYTTSADSAATILVGVRCGPVANHVTLATPGWEERLAIEAGAERTVAIPTIVEPDLGVRLAALDISVQDGFVPAEVDRASTDRRFLGCWIEMGRVE